MPESIEYLGAEAEGQWVVTTQGSTHLWDMDRMVYQRRPGPNSRGIGFYPGFNEVEHPIHNVRQWPRVGSSFVVGVGPDQHMSSTIKSIERVSDDAH